MLDVIAQRRRSVSPNPTTRRGFLLYGNTGVSERGRFRFLPLSTYIPLNILGYAKVWSG